MALDIGTSSCRAALFDGRGTRVPGSLVQRTYPLETDGDGAAELDPEVLLAEVKKCLKGAKAAGEFEAVGVSCFWHSLIGTDDKGAPLTPVYTWADSRCRGDAAALRAQVSEEEAHAETGCMLRASFWPAKLRWLSRTRPGVFRKVKRWMSPAEWLQWQITGEYSAALGMATGTGLFNPATNRWSGRMLEIVGVAEEKLPGISDAPSDWKGAAWYPGIGDGATSNLGCGATSEGLAAINFGTSAAIRVMKEGERPSAPFGLFCYRVDERRYLVGGAVSNAGNLHAWCVRELKLPKGQELEKEMAERPLPEHGLTVLPFWTAERAPTWDENAVGLIQGIRQSTTSLDLLQAISEASCIRLSRIAAMMGLDENAKCVVSGGILNSGSAMTRLANVMGRPIFKNPEQEGSLRGAAVFALEKMGQPITPLKYGKAVPFSASVHRRYCEERKKQENLE